MDGLDHSPRSHLDNESRHILMGFFGGFRFTECMKKKIIKKTTLQRQGNSTTMLSKGYASLSGVIWPVMTPWISPQMRFVFCENNNQMSERIYLSLCMFAFLLSLSMVTALLLGMLLWLFSTSLCFKMKYLSHWIANFFAFVTAIYGVEKVKLTWL